MSSGPSVTGRRAPGRGARSISSGRSSVPVAARPLDAGEDARVVAGLEVELGGGDHGLHRGPRARPSRRRRGTATPGRPAPSRRSRCSSSSSSRSRFIGLIDTRDAAGLPRAEHARSRTGARSAGTARRGRPARTRSSRPAAKRVGQLVELAQRDPAVEVVDRVAVRVARDRGAEHRQRVRELGARSSRRLALVRSGPATAFRRRCS